MKHTEVNKMLAHGYRVIVTFNDGSETRTYEYKSEKVADSVIRSYRRQSFVANVIKEEL